MLIDRMLNEDKDEPHFDRGCCTYDGPVIENVYNKVRKFTSENIIFITLSDGAPGGIDYGGESAVQELNKIIEKCRRDGFVTVGFGLNEDSTDELNHIRDIYTYNHIIDVCGAQKEKTLLGNLTLINI